MKSKVLILAPYPLEEAPSQRFRFEHYLGDLNKDGIDWSFQSFYTRSAWKKLYNPQYAKFRIIFILHGFLRRLWILPFAFSYRYIFIHRELTPLGPPIFEWILSRVFRKKIIFDFDDAIWMNDGHDSKLGWLIKARWKIAQICKWSWKTTVGNNFLGAFALNQTKNVILMPTVVNTQIHKPEFNQYSKIVIGWTGSHSTLFYLNELIPVLQELQTRYDFQFLVIANRDPQLPLKNYQFIKWRKEAETEDLRKMDIGVMPLEDTEWAKGKCGFKLIQYLSIGIPAVASPVGVNSDIIIPGQTGYLAMNPAEWKSALEKLIQDESLRKALGENGRKLIVEKYSTESQKELFLNLFKG